MSTLRQSKPLPVLLIEQGREKATQNSLADAEALFRHAIDVASNCKATDISRLRYRALALFNLGRVLEKQGKPGAAIGAFQEALEIHPQGIGRDDFERIVNNNLGNVFKALNRLNEACKHFERSAQLKPAVTVYVKLGNTLKKAGRSNEAIAAYDRALALDPSFHLARFGRCIAQLPIIYRDTSEILESRRRYQTALQMLCDHYEQVTAAERAAAAEVVGLLQPFYLAYQGRNDRLLQQLYGKLVCRLMSERFPQWSRPVAVRPRAEGEKLRIGIVSRFLLSRHSVWKIPLKGWAENIDRTRFDLYGYHTHPGSEYGQDGSPELFTRFVSGRRSVEAWCNEIQDDRLDAIIYAEIGMDPFSLPLACLRLAPLQMAGLGHPLTSGLPTVDYYVSGELLEREDAQDHYTESLLRLPNLSFCYMPLTMEADTVERSSLGVSHGEALFWCPQSLFKFLPEHDDVFPRIARETGPCKFLFNPRTKDRVSAAFSERLRRSFEAHGLNADEFCILRFGISQKEYNGINAIADVFLDSIGWSGGNTNIEALAYDLPIVTLPSPFLRGRLAFGMLKLMGVEETIAASKDEYVQLAARLARDGSYRRRIADLIACNKHKVYEDLTVVRALEDFLTGEVDRRRGDGSAYAHHTEKSPAGSS